ncbi:MAG TPA: SMC-Scp complex subunit ScpB [Solirubrobacteraceae bacterium]|nr:SMC-Scp complex subunit ScpB [Solirubrobacteraceae bacterium]
MERVTRQALEAILFVSDEPVDAASLAQVLDEPADAVLAALEALAADLEASRRGMVLRQVAGGWRLYSAPDAAPYVERFVLAGRSGRLSAAALETLAVIAYKQPISRAEIGEVRGVNVDGAVRTLVTRGLVEEVGRDPGPGQAILYGTTREFLEQVGLNDLGDLPPLSEFLPTGPAPDEPAPELLRAARAHLQAGGELSATGRPWDPSDPGASAGTDRSGDGSADMDELSGALERAARGALSTLETAMRAAGLADDQDDADDDASSAEVTVTDLDVAAEDEVARA